MVKRKIILKLFVAITLVLQIGTLSAPLVVHAQDFRNGTGYCLTNDDSDSSSDSSSDDSSNSSSSGTAGSTSTPKGQVPKDRVDNIIKLAKHMNSEYGFGENQLAVIMAVALRESTWDFNANNTSGQVAGLFQWGYGSTNGDRIHPAGADPNNMNYDNTVKVLDYEIKGGKNAQTTRMMEEMSKAGNDKSRAFQAWARFEGVSVSDGQSKTDEVISWADQIAGIISSNDLKINQSKIDSIISSYGGTPNTANTTTADTGTTTDVANTSKCGESTTESTEADGTGSVTSKGAWKHDEVPDDIKKYITHPEQANMTFGDSKNFLSGISDGTQCTDFAESYFNQIWGLGMTSGVQGNGEAVAGSMAQKFGGSTSNTPKAGAIASIPGGKGGTSAGVGHVYIVSHVLENGDIIIAEQNYDKYSGQLAGMRYSWNYRLISKATYTSEGHSFYTPQGKSNPNLK